MDIQESSILVVGANGLIGSQVVNSLLARGVGTIWLDEQASKQFDDSRVRYLKRSASSPEVLSLTLREIDAVVFLGEFDNKTSTAAEYLHFLMNLLEACRDSNCAHFIYSSTESLDGDTSPHRLIRSEIGAVKLAAEAVCSAFFSKFKRPLIERVAF